MNTTEAIHGPFPRSAMFQLALLLILTITFWATGAPSLLHKAKAANITSIKDVLSDSDLSASANHTFTFTLPNGVSAAETITITFPAEFTLNAFDFADVDLADDGSDLALAATCSGATWGAAVSGQTLTLTSCSGVIASSSVVTVEIGTNATNGTTGDTQISNPSSAASYEIVVDGTSPDRGATRVVILNDVDVTASVNTIFTFTVTGLATSSTVNGEVTTGSTTPTVMAFNTLVPDATSTLGQRLTVNTNARNGFSVTVQEAANLTSSTGADIDLFIDGATTTVPAAWQAPASTMNSENTYGHWGVTSSDNVTSSSTAPGEFGTGAIPLYAGNFNTAREVFYHNGPVNGTTDGQGFADVAYTVEIGNLQEAGTDYNTTIWYVATPTF